MNGWIDRGTAALGSGALRAGQFVKSTAGKVGAGVGALVASGAAMAQATSPGSAIASELSNGKSEVMLVIGAASIIIGVLVLWHYVKRAR